jgi:[ribosomal protein S18]-alanine N-acetyltransferase
MNFEPLTPENAQASFDLHANVQINPWSTAIFIDCLSSPYFAYQLVERRDLLGYYIGLQVLDEVTLMDIAIDPQKQGQGLGKQLLANFISQVRLRNGVDIWLEVRESNIAAQHLYTKMGFDIIEKRKAYYQTKTGTESALIMKLTLGKEALDAR